MSCDSGQSISISPSHPLVANATNEILARVNARRATGSSTGVTDEWKFLLQADISTIVRKTYRLDSSTPDTAIDTTSLTVANVIYDTAQTWSRDSVGWNFADAISSSVITVAGAMYRIDYIITLVAGLGSGVGIVRIESRAV